MAVQAISTASSCGSCDPSWNGWATGARTPLCGVAAAGDRRSGWRTRRSLLRPVVNCGILVPRARTGARRGGFAMPVDLSQLRLAASEARINWQPGETRHVGMSRLQAHLGWARTHRAGSNTLQRREETARAAAARGDDVRSAAATPAKFDWRKADGGNYVSPVKDQAGCGSCVAFGATAVLESMVRIAAKQPGLLVDLSEAHVFFCYGPDHGAGPCPDGGWWPDDAFAAMKARGGRRGQLPLHRRGPAVPARLGLVVAADEVQPLDDASERRAR